MIVECCLALHLKRSTMGACQGPEGHWPRQARLHTSAALEMITGERIIDNRKGCFVTTGQQQLAEKLRKIGNVGPIPTLSQSDSFGCQRVAAFVIMDPVRLIALLLLLLLAACRGRIIYTPVPDSMLDEITPYMLRKVKSLDECISMCLERLMFCYSVVYETPKKSTDGKALCKFAYWQASNCTAKLERIPGIGAPLPGMTRAYSCIYCVDDYPGSGQQSLVEMAKALINKLAARRTAANVRCPEPPPTQNCQNATDVVDGEQVNNTEMTSTASTYAEPVCGTNFTFYHQPSDFPLQEATYSAVANVTDMTSCAVHCHRAVFCRTAFFDPLLGNCRLSYKKFPCVNREAPPGSNSTIVLSCIGCK
ncbi:hypothetical protein TTRE_0000385501 [Trichuris trichiura]|uniref:Apple domain-containing protein n=1 Tax=Trichuris trichiura TaxID=36087 RepID=A0A077Z517_TRITR|nr:hypothetical protein TTRE_0000385501 [Trichuris trichiura]